MSFKETHYVTFCFSLVVLFLRILNMKMSASVGIIKSVPLYFNNKVQKPATYLSSLLSPKHFTVGSIMMMLYLES